MRRLYFAAGLVGSTLLPLLGCEDDRHKTLKPLDAAAPSTQPAAPTTQELLTAAPTRTAIRVIPFWISLPPGWAVKTDAGVTILHGPTPAGVAQIQIGRHGSPIEKHAEMLITGAKKAAATHPGPYTLAEVRTLGGVQVLETRSIGANRATPAIDSAGNIIAPNSTPLEWKISAFVPDGKSTVICEAYFVDLTQEQYDRDKELLDKIVASLEYDPNMSNN